MSDCATGQCDQQVFEVAMIWCGTDETAAGPNRRKAAGCVWTRRVQMFYHFGADDDVEWLDIQVVQQLIVRSEHFESGFRICLSGDGHTTFAEIDAHNLTPSLQKSAGGEAVPATDIKHSRTGPQQ